MVILRLLLLAAVMAGVHDFVLAGTRDPNTPDEKYLEFGQQFPSVVRLMALTEMPDKETGEMQPTFQFGSAVVIKPNWVLTAAHVVHNTQVPVVLTDKGGKHALLKVIIPKEFTEERFGFYDIALGYTADDFGLDFYPELYTDKDELGKPITFAGYGFTGTFHTGHTANDNKKRAGHNKIDGLQRAILICTPSAGAGRMPLEYMICPGDSGGGMFIGNKLAGINSFLMATDKKPNGTYGDESAFTRISLYADWVKSQIEKHELSVAGRGTMGADINYEVSDTGLQLADVEEVLPK